MLKNSKSNFISVTLNSWSGRKVLDSTTYVSLVINPPTVRKLDKATRIRAGLSGVRILIEARHFLFSKTDRSGFGNHPAFYPTGSRDLRQE